MWSYMGWCHQCCEWLLKKIENKKKLESNMDPLSRIFSVCNQRRWKVRQRDQILVHTPNSTFSVSPYLSMKHVSGDEYVSLKAIRDISVLALDQMYYPVTLDELYSMENYPS